MTQLGASINRGRNCNAIAYIPPGVFWSRWGRQRSSFSVGNVSNNVFSTKKNFFFIIMKQNPNVPHFDKKK